MNRYVGNKGIVERIPEPVTHGVAFAAPEQREELREEHHAGSGRGLLGSLPFGNFLFDKKPPEQSLFGGLGGLLSKFTKDSLEMEDYLLLGMLYLLYRESGDLEFLLIAGAMLIL